MAPVTVFAEVVRGRSLCFSPSWDSSEPSVVFDRNSGDYWVLAPLARTVVGLLSNGGPLTPVEICDALQAQQISDELVNDALEATLDGLVHAGILTFPAARAPH